MKWTDDAMQALEDILEKITIESVKSGIDPKAKGEQFRYQFEELLHRGNYDEVTERIVLQLTEQVVWAGPPHRSWADTAIERFGRRIAREMAAPIRNGWASFVSFLTPYSKFLIKKRKKGMDFFRSRWGRGVRNFQRVMSPSRSWWKSYWPLVLGVIYPLLFFISNFWVYGSNFQEKDWFPTVGHALLALLVPMSILLGINLRGRRRGPPPRWIQLITGGGVAVADIYTWVVGLSPFSLNQNLSLWSWARFLLFVPVLSLIATTHIWTRISRGGSKWLWVGALLATVIFSSFHASETVTLMAMRGAMKGAAAVHAIAVEFLRAYGREDVLRAACSGQLRISPLNVWGRLVAWGPDPDDARRLFFQVTGRSYKDLSDVSGGFPWEDRLAQGGTVAGDFQKDLVLLTSQFNVTPSPDALTAFIEWKMEFENNKRYSNPIRALIALPPGGVVTGLSVGMDGQERGTLFKYSGKPRDDDQSNGLSGKSLEYATVTSAGLDRVFIHCFPVFYQGGRFQITLGITTPLVSKNPSEAKMFGPFFIERNFEVPAQLRHDQIIIINREKEIHNQLTDQFLSSGEAWNVWPRNPLADTAWTPDPSNSSRFFQQDIFWHGPKLEECVIVLDSSAGLAPFRRALKEVFLSFPKDLKVFLGRDGTPQTYTVRDLLSRWDRLEFVGGQDNLPALLAGFESSPALGPRSVLWIHGPQVVELSSHLPLRRFLDHWGQRGWDYRTLFSWQIVPGPHRTLEWLDGLENVKTLRLGNLVGFDPTGLFVSATPARRISLLEMPKFAPLGERTTLSVAQLGSRERVARALLGRWENATDSPIPIQEETNQQANACHLVTPVTGAISPPQGQKTIDAPLGVNREATDSGSHAHLVDQCLLSIGSEPSKICQGRAYLPWNFAHPGILIKQFVCELGHPSRFSWRRTPAPTWFALSPLFYFLIFQQWRLTKNNKWRWAAVVLGLYSASFLLFPSYVVTLSGIMAGTFLLMLHQPGQPQIKITLAFVFLTLPASPFFIEGFVKSLFVPFGTWPFHSFISSEPYLFLAKFAWVITFSVALCLFFSKRGRKTEKKSNRPVISL